MPHSEVFICLLTRFAFFLYLRHNAKNGMPRIVGGGDAGININLKLGEIPIHLVFSTTL